MDQGRICDILWHFKEPQLVGAYWFVKAQEAIKQLKNEGQHLKDATQRKGILDISKKKLNKLTQAKFDQAKLLEKLLAPLEVFSEAADKIPPVVLNNLFPNQNLLTYVNNIHRDWQWGDEENAASAKMIKEILPEGINDIVYLGSGASRLAYDVHRLTEVKKTTLVDLNPLLLISAKKIIEGETVKLYDFPIAPKGLENAFILNKLKAEKPNKNEFNYFFSDVLNLPFEKESQSCIVSPWLIDILPGNPANLLSEINRVLKTNGTWIHFGPLGFNFQPPEYHLSKEELINLASELGFSCEMEEENVLPYMDSPYSQHGRRESVYCIRFKKEKATEKSTDVDNDKPEWLVDTSKAVPLDDNMKTLKETHKIYHTVLSHVDGYTPIEALAKELGPQWGLKQEEALKSLVNFFKSL